MEDELPHIFIRHQFRFLESDQFALNSLLHEFVTVQSVTVVFDCDPNLATNVERLDLNLACSFFSNLYPFFRCLDPMIDGVTQDMDQWICDFLDDRLVYFSFLTFNLQLNNFVGFLCDISNQTVQTAEGAR
ncbi:hypothetical protein BMS3Bbin04_02085 [bacterium BMS3Bbin04]|nr:hypothetical protein BMS3Bbin04_02085 [bacterium BMS3Bbin04]